MVTETRRITTNAELLEAANDLSVGKIEVAADLVRLPNVRLSPGQSLTAAGSTATLRFAAGQDGLQLSTDNQVEGIELVTDPDHRALFNDTRVAQLGRLVLKNLRTTGVV